jgi:hypothetical protein
MSQDLHIYGTSMSNESGEKLSVPFLQKQVVYVTDNNNSINYNRNSVEFDTTNISNNGKWSDFQNAYISIPLVMTVTRDAGHAITAADAQDLLQMKGSNLSLIDSIQVEMNNTIVVQSTKNISPLFNFKKHTSMSTNDVELHGHTDGYQKHSSADWSWSAPEGLHNDSSMGSKFYHEEKLPVVSVADLKSSGSNCQSQSPAVVGGAAAGIINHFFYDCVIKLKDLPFFEKLPMIRGGLVKLTLTLNQSDTKITVVGDAKTAVVSTLTGSSMPVIRKAGGEVAEYVEDISVKVVSNAQGVIHNKQQCRLYIPTYTMESSAEQQYLSLGSKKVLYTDVYHQRVRGVAGSFNTSLTNSMARMKRLIIVPVLAASANGTLGLDPALSPFTADGVGTCSPYAIQNFNVALSGTNLYQSPVTYKYEHYLNEMKLGVNSGMESGVSSGLISQKDFESNYGYLVMDLSRRYDYDENTPLSLEISGTVSSSQALDMLCYIEFEKDVTIDLATGQLI